MKAILTFVFFIFITTTAMASTGAKQVKVDTLSYGVELSITIEKSDIEKTEVARLYKRKNSRIKKALKFTTKRNKAKMA